MSQQVSARPIPVVGGVLAAAVVASAGNAVVSLLARAAGASSWFQALNPASYVPLTVIGIVLGAAGWGIVRRLAKNPRRLLGRLAPIVVVVSFVPDLALLGANQPGTSALAVAALMVMHVLVAAVALFACGRVLPLAPAGVGSEVFSPGTLGYKR